jgi:LCP family protein required for cell wall assembly
MPLNALAKKNIILFSLVGLLIFFSSFCLSYFLLGKIIYRDKPIEVDNSPAKTPTPYFGETQKRQNVKNILLVGFGGAEHSGGTLADSIIVISIDNQNKKTNLISIPRDIWIDLPTDWENLKPAKINEAYAIGLDDSRYPNKKPEFRGALGGGNMEKFAVGQVTGLSMDYFVSVSFDQIEKIIDTLGGVEVDVLVSFSDEYYPVKGLENETCGKTAQEMEALKLQYSGFELEKQYKCRYETLSFEKGLNKMDGVTALKFVRSRHSAQSGGDFARSMRQMSLLLAIKQKLISLKAVERIDELYPSLTKLVTTDLNLATAKELLSFLGNADGYLTGQINLTNENVLVDSKSPQGQYILLPKAGFGKWQETQDFINAQIQN